MWRRSRYLIDSFFDTSASISDVGIRATTGWARYNDEEAQGVLDYRARSTLASRMAGLVSLMALDADDNRVGFVGVGLNEAVATEVVRATTIAAGRGSKIA